MENDFSDNIVYEQHHQQHHQQHHPHYQQYTARINEVLEMNAGWQRAYSEMAAALARTTEKIASLEQTLAESKQREGSLVQKIDELRSDVSLLKMQACVYKEDYEAERAQRTELGGKLDLLQQELSRNRAPRVPAGTPGAVAVDRRYVWVYADRADDNATHEPLLSREPRRFDRLGLDGV